MADVDRFCQTCSVLCLALSERQNHNVCQHWAPRGWGCRVLNGAVCETGWLGLECECVCAQGCVVAWTLAELASPTVADSGSSKYACLMRENRELKKHRKLKPEREQLKQIKNIQPFLAGKVKCLIKRVYCIVRHYISSYVKHMYDDGVTHDLRSAERWALCFHHKDQPSSHPSCSAVTLQTYLAPPEGKKSQQYHFPTSV